MTSTPAAALGRELERSLPDRPFSVDFWDGTRVPATAPGPTFSVRSPDAVARALRAPGQLGLGRAYVAGELEVDDVDGVVHLLDHWDPPSLGRGARLRLALAAARAGGLRRSPPPPAAELRVRGRLHSRRRDAAAVRHHYDVSNEFFALFLDESMTYSCGLFRDGATTLEEAQEAKLELVCRKLRLQPGQRVLDVGCGWGSFALHAAARHDVSVVGITLSEPQAELARERVRAAGYDDRIDIQVADYRDLGGEGFDAIASIGMVEHVGAERIDEYGRALAAALRPGGRLLNHGITRLMNYGHEEGKFTLRYVFPDARPLHLDEVVRGLEKAGFEPRHVEDMREDYAETLRHWAARLDARLEDAVRLAGPERVRVWRLYLRAARNGFQMRTTSVFQVLCELPGGVKAEAPALDAAAVAAAPA
ncbi:MAG: cyclopropane-fatty-acyl-phospholipid synthase [Solirubrobacteraceae bacterium]|nr:cyclopropane-fatty-acyl-phospholipid synthase [Solirubrobacteraceae bacterium]